MSVPSRCSSRRMTSGAGIAMAKSLCRGLSAAVVKAPPPPDVVWMSRAYTGPRRRADTSSRMSSILAISRSSGAGILPFGEAAPFRRAAILDGVHARLRSYAMKRRPEDSACRLPATATKSPVRTLLRSLTRSTTCSSARTPAGSLPWSPPTQSSNGPSAWPSTQPMIPSGRTTLPGPPGLVSPLPSTTAASPPAAVLRGDGTPSA